MKTLSNIIELLIWFALIVIVSLFLSFIFFASFPFIEKYPILAGLIFLGGTFIVTPKQIYVDETLSNCWAKICTGCYLSTNFGSLLYRWLVTILIVIGLTTLGFIVPLLVSDAIAF